MTARMAHAAVNLRGIVIQVYSDRFKSSQVYSNLEKNLISRLKINPKDLHRIIDRARLLFHHYRYPIYRSKMLPSNGYLKRSSRL